MRVHAFVCVCACVCLIIFFPLILRRGNGIFVAAALASHNRDGNYFYSWVYCMRVVDIEIYVRTNTVIICVWNVWIFFRGITSTCEFEQDLHLHTFYKYWHTWMCRLIVCVHWNCVCENCIVHVCAWISVFTLCLFLRMLTCRCTLHTHTHHTQPRNVHVCTRERIHIFSYIRFTHTHTHTLTHSHTHTFTHTHIYVTHTRTRTHSYMHTHTHPNTHVYTYIIHTCIACIYAEPIHSCIYMFYSHTCIQMCYLHMS